MSESLEQEQVQTEEQELASALAGYNARGDTPPADEPETSQQPEEVAAPAIDEVPAAPSVADELAALKAKVKEMQGSGDSEAVRRLHGEIGNINRTIQQMQAPAKAAEAPATDEFADALAAAEREAEEFPDAIGGTVRLVKLMAARQKAAPVVDVVPPDEVIAAKVTAIRRADAIEALADEHPDFETVRDTPEYKAWLQSKTPEFQQRFTSTWNPAVVSRGLTDFKTSLAAKQAAQQKKTNRLAAAVTPQGVPVSGGPSTIPDEEGFARGYGRKRR